MLNAKQIKKDFPILQRKINGKSIVYLDNAAMSQKPQVVIDAVTDAYAMSMANVGRGIYTLSEETTKKFEETREKVSKFINAESVSEIIFTHNTTHAINYVAYGLGQSLKKDDVILLTEMEHHSNIVPWQRIAKEKAARLLYVAINDEGLLINDIKDENDKIVYKHFKDIPNLKIVSLCHASNVLGTINPIERIIAEIKKLRNGEIKVVIDAAQSVPHMPIDVQKMDCDFLALSGYKMLGPSGVGVLYGKKKLLNEMEPLIIGSHMIAEVLKGRSTWSEVPGKFEAGTHAVEAVIGLGAAIDYLNKIGMETIRQHEKQLTKYALDKLGEIDGLTIYGPKDVEQRAGVIPFNIKGVHSHDVAQILNEDNICVRSGHHCAMPLHITLAAEASTRASFYLYNDEEDIDALVEGIMKVKKVFKVA